jgi:hypothetical protein
MNLADKINSLVEMANGEEEMDKDAKNGKKTKKKSSEEDMEDEDMEEACGKKHKKKKPMYEKKVISQSAESGNRYEVHGDFVYLIADHTVYKFKNQGNIQKETEKFFAKTPVTFESILKFMQKTGHNMV